MAGTLVFVHGTGGRFPALRKSWDKLTDTAGKHGIVADFVRADWGPQLGAPLDRVALTLPPTATPDAEDQPRDETSHAAWAPLWEDPLVELRLVPELTAPEKRPRPNERLGSVDTYLRRLLTDPQGYADKLERGGLDLAAVGVAVDEVMASVELGTALTWTRDGGRRDLVTTCVRAVVAHAATSGGVGGGRSPAVLFETQLRAQLVDEMVQAALPGGDRSAARMAEVFAGFVTATFLSWRVKRHRGGAMDVTSAFLADILAYQRRGEQIRELVRNELVGRPGPVVAVGHSLGGIILFDLLTGPDAPHVDLLVTLGSQAPLLYAVDALAHVRPDQLRTGTALAADWLNIYDDSDLLGFCAERVMGDIAPSVRDVRVNTGPGFPLSHIGYGRDAGVWKVIADAWPSA